MAISLNSQTRALTGLFLITGLYILFFHCPPAIFSTALCIAMSIMILELKNMIANSTLFTFLLPLYPIMPCCIMLYFNHTPRYNFLLHYLFVLSFSFDSASYIAGKIAHKFWSTHKIIPTISPGKSWEGFIGGIIAVTTLINCMTYKQHTTAKLIFISCGICTIAFIGDIFESFLKRSANLKDSGTILPGHGGLLDRFDSILATSYFFFICKNYLIYIFT